MFVLPVGAAFEPCKVAPSSPHWMPFRTLVPDAETSLRSFGAFFNTSLEGVEFPDLQSMTFGYYFDQSLEKVGVVCLVKGCAIVGK